MSLHRAPDPLPAALQEQARALAQAWLGHPSCPRIEPSVAAEWGELIAAWLGAPELPLYVRKARGNKGSLLTHESGRQIVPVDNSPAQWAYWEAAHGRCPSLADVHELMERDKIPVAFALSAAEGKAARYRCGLAAHPLNAFGWKLCHIDPVALGHRGDVRAAPLELIESHFRRQISPANLFVVPKVWAGLGELPELTAAARELNSRA